MLGARPPGREVLSLKVEYICHVQAWKQFRSYDVLVYPHLFPPLFTKRFSTYFPRQWCNSKLGSTLKRICSYRRNNSFLKELIPITWRINENGKDVSPGIVPTDLNPTALRKVKIVYNFDLSECSRVKA